MSAVLGTRVSRTEGEIIDQKHALLMLLPAIDPTLWDEVMDQVKILQAALETFYSPATCAPATKYAGDNYADLLSWLASATDVRSPSQLWILNRISIPTPDTTDLIWMCEPPAGVLERDEPEDMFASIEMAMMA